MEFMPISDGSGDIWEWLAQAPSLAGTMPKQSLLHELVLHPEYPDNQFGAENELQFERNEDSRSSKRFMLFSLLDWHASSANWILDKERNALYSSEQQVGIDRMDKVAKQLDKGQLCLESTLN